MIETRGSNFKDLLTIPFVDTTKTISSDLWDIYEIFGIEAVRQFLINDFMRIMGGINIAHPTLLADKMTWTGTVFSISRYSMRHETNAVFQKISFEETLDNFITSSVFGEIENIQGVSASIVCGQRSHIGTGFCDVKLDVDEIIKRRTISMDDMIVTDSDSDSD